VAVSAIEHLDFENIFGFGKKNLAFYNFYNFYNFIFIFDIQCPFIVCIFEKIADTDTDIYPKTFLETVSAENQFCILAGSGRPGSEIIQPFSGSNMNFR
jgi:hypothetical protein